MLMGGKKYPPKILALLTCFALAVSCGNRSTDIDANQPPAVPSNPSPANGASNQELDVQLSWECSDPDGDEISYDLYFGTGSNPPIFNQGFYDTTQNIGDLDYDSVYYWRIVAKDSLHLSAGPVWSFETAHRPEIRLVSSYEIPWYAFNIWVSEQFIYLASGSSLQIIDASDPTTPVFASSIEAEEEEFVRDVAIHENIAYLAMGSGGMQIYNVLDPYNPVHLGGFPWPDTGNASARALYVLDNYVYVVDYGLGNLWIIDISEPANPSLVSVSDSPHDWWGLTNVLVAGDYAYVVVKHPMPVDSDLIGVIDLTNILNPHTVNLLSPGGGSCYEIAARENYLFFPRRASQNLQIFDISDPPNPVLVSYYSAPGMCEDVFIMGDYAFISIPYYGLHMVDISDPESPLLVTEYSELGHLMEIYADENYIYLTKSRDRLFIFELLL
jgi:hypothetical protein